jgi:hypothetical protein
MKNMKLNLIALIAGVMLLSGCSISEDDNYCYDRYFMATTAVTGPNETTVNVPITLNVTFVVGNSCGEFFEFAESTTTFPKEIAAAVDYEGCQCDTTATTDTQPYVFTAPAAGTYVLKFVTSDPQLPITRTIVVTE